MTQKEDLRVQRTKKLLADSFMELLAKKPFEDITVNELCEMAGIRRATFYKHYADKFAFLTSYTHALRDRFDSLFCDSGKPMHTADYYIAYAKRLVEYVTEYSVAIDNMVSSELFHVGLSLIIEQNFKDTCERLEASKESGLKLPASVEVTAAMCASGVAGAVYQWIKGGRKTPREEFAEEVGAIVSAIIQGK